MKAFVIHDPRLTNREHYMNSTINKLNKLDSNIDFEIVYQKIDLTQEQISLKTRLQKIGDEQFDKLLTPINKFHIDNIENHRSIYKHMIDKNISEAWIFEDDTVLSSEHTEYMKEFLSINKPSDFHMIITGFSTLNAPHESFKFLDLKDYYPMHKVLPSKASYIITLSLATKLYEYTSIYRYPMKGMISKFLFDNKENIKCYMANRYLLLEASKIGLLPTSINHSNILVFNPEYIDLVKLLHNRDNIDLSKAKAIFEKMKVLNSPDVYHIMGIIYNKKQMYEESKECFEQAVKILHTQKGYIGRNSDILNNCINSFQYNQP